ncbi:actin depolymerizing protein [Lichtheimia hyalospora FSU 10163]|nr:actin depolymerizing protein [Lichtheimia hyalospora FSU 10163]
MLRNSTWRLDETNLANFGSELERQHRKEEGSLEQAWNYEGSPIGKEPGMWIWRVQSFELVTVPENKYGQFYQGDSYVVLKTTLKQNSDALVHNIHFWLGMETTQDEAGTAAYKTVELDDFLDGLATQHREVQRRESRMFKSYFSTLKYLQGGFASGFNHVEEEEFHKRLLRVHRPDALEGTRTRNAVVITEVPMSHESLRSKAVFVLDAGAKVYQWQGKESRGVERAKAAEYISQLISERNGDGEMVVIEQDSGSAREFWEELGSEGDIADNDDDDEVEEQVDESQDLPKKLFVLRKSHASLGLKLKFELVAEDKINKEMFDTNHVYIFDVGHQVYTWIGHEAGRRERRAGLQYAQDYVKDSGRSAFTPICKIVEGGEDELFESSLEGWQGW